MKKIAFAAAAALSTISAHAAAQDYTALGTAASDALTGLAPVLFTVGGVLIGISGVVMAIRYVRKLAA